MTDLVTFGESMLRYSPPGHERLELARELDVRIAGAESNVAACVQRLGLDAVWTSKLPDSPLGRKVLSDLGRHGLECDVAWSADGRLGTYYIEQAGAPRGTNVIYDRADAAVTTATADELPTDRIAGATAFHTTGITPALSETLAETTRELLAHASEHGTTTYFDLNYRSKLWSPAEARESLERLFDDVDVLVVAERDAAEVLERSGDPVEVARGLAADFGFETVLVTLGEAGALAVHGDDVVEQGAFEADTHDPIGTGDAFVGGYLARRLRGDDVEASMAYGAATAALKRTIPGDVAAVTPEEVERVLDADVDEISR